MANDLDLDAIRARWADVSPWPWKHEVGDHLAKPGWLVADLGDTHAVATAPCPARDARWREAVNAEAIAHAPEDIAALVAEVERLRHVNPTNTSQDSTVATKLLNTRLRKVRDKLALEEKTYLRQLKVAAFKKTKKAVNAAKDTAACMRENEREISELTSALTVLGKLQ